MTAPGFLRDAEDCVRRALLRWSCRDFRRRAVPVVALGDHISTEILIRGYFEAHALRQLQRVLEENRVTGGVALDIGANIGNHAIFLSSCFDKVYAFEPNPVTFSILTANVLMTGCAAEPVALALSSRDGASEIAFDGADLGGASLSQRPNGTRRFPIVTTTLDHWLARASLAPSSIGLIKLDVEGHEIEVLRGATATLHACDALIAFETSSATDPLDLIALLRAAGYGYFYEIRKRARSPNLIVWCFETLRFGVERATIPAAIESAAYREMALASKRPLLIPTT